MKCEKCFKECSKRCCPYPRCLLGCAGKTNVLKSDRLKKYLALPFPEDDI